MSRQELYRFMCSFSIVKYLPILSAVLLVICCMDIFLSECEDKATCAVRAWAEIGNCFIYFVLMIIAVISVYIGQEIKNKTLNYEIMSGMNTFKISCDKTVSCGFLIPIIVIICLVVYLSGFQAINDKQDIFRLFLIMLILSHVASAVLMYVLICKNAILGAIIAFVKFTLIETAFNQISKNIISENIHEIIDKMCILIQIQNITIVNVNTSLIEIALYVIISFVLEYFLLQFIYYMSANYLLEPGV
ncbi:MAG: hypothetical protein ACI4D8_07380 [Wujia sp.]